MAERPWVTPQEIRDYSENEKVQQRSDARLSVDIARAEMYVMTYTHNKFEKYGTIPESVRMAVLLLAESYGKTAIASKSGMKSETFDDYSYTAQESVNVEGLDLAALLDDFVVTKARNTITMRMRKL